MADVNPTPGVRCDNCGTIEDKVKRDYSNEWNRPARWGNIFLSGRGLYKGYPDDLKLSDLCPKCLHACHEAVERALKETRE